MKRKIFWEDRSDRAIADLLRKARLTQNPLYYWEAIRISEWFGAPLPPECLQYIYEVARDMSLIIADARVDRLRCTPDAAALLAAERMEFAGRERNAFRRLAADDFSVGAYVFKWRNDNSPAARRWARLLQQPATRRFRRRVTWGGGCLAVFGGNRDDC